MRRADPEAVAFAEKSAVYLPRAWDPRMHLKAATLPAAWSGRHLRMVWAAVKACGASPAHGVRNLFHINQGLALEEGLLAHRIERVHAHFASLPSTLAWVACAATGLPFSFSAHARDLFVEGFLLEAKVEAAGCVFVCHSRAEAWLKDRLPPELRSRVVLMRHGLDMDEFPPPPRRHRTAGSGSFRVLAVGRLVEKKGFRYLIGAAGLLRQEGEQVMIEIVGEGPERGRLEEAIYREAVGDVCTLTGALPFAEVRRRMLEADALVCPSIAASDGDMDGIPNAVLEAQACGLPVIATDAGGLPDAVAHGETGLVVPQRDPSALAAAIRRLMGDGLLAARLAAAARARIGESFDIRNNIAPLAAMLGLQSNPPRDKG
ncbi:MAG: glycosyltransferase [Planctomycetota bacterium]|nr:glycosyltransferase [Planctomycetota bacterium]